MSTLLNWHAIRAIYRFEMARTFRTLTQIVLDKANGHLDDVAEVDVLLDHGGHHAVEVVEPPRAEGILQRQVAQTVSAL